MTRKALVEREKKRKNVRLKYSSKRVHIKDELQKLQKDPSNNFDAIQELYSQLQSLPRNASPVRERRRCRLTGRPRGVYRKVELCRNMFRIYAMKGQIPGITKASW